VQIVIHKGDAACHASVTLSVSAEYQIQAKWST
jgi:hypothetical protein